MTPDSPRPSEAAAFAAGLPILVTGARRRALVVGGGAVASRKVDALLDAGAARVRVVAPRICAPIREAAARWGAQRLALAEREYDAGDLADANIVVAATDARAVNARVARDADALGRLACVVDAPDDGTWTSMATHRAGPLVVAVATGGVPTAAASIRDRIATHFGGRYGEALARLAAVRTALLRRDERDRWREATRELVADDFCDSVESGELESRLARWEEKLSWA